MYKEAEKALTKAKIALLNNKQAIFYSHISLSIPHSFDSSIPTACTNGKWIKYNPDFFTSLKLNEQVFLILHEVLHIAYLHMERAKKFDKNKFNRACDYVINQQLINAGFSMPADGLYDPKYADMSAEQVYKLLDDSETDPKYLDLVPSEGSSEELTEHVRDILIKAATQARMEGQAGSIPKDLAIYLDSLLNPKLPWNRLLAKYMQASVREDYSYRKPNRRYLPKFYVPTLHSEGLDHIAVAVDTSGSITNKDFQQFISEVNKIITKLKPSKLTLIQFDTCIKSIDVIKTSRDLMSVKFKGRGGTCVNEVINWITSNKPIITVMLTDGEFYSRATTKQQVLWVIHNNKDFNSAFGKIVHYEL
jgi:predicted metal-dependent peptidase